VTIKPTLYVPILNDWKKLLALEAFTPFIVHCQAETVPSGSLLFGDEPSNETLALLPASTLTLSVWPCVAD
jgi:hypothetical protein